MESLTEELKEAQAEVKVADWDVGAALYYPISWMSVLVSHSMLPGALVDAVVWRVGRIAAEWDYEVHAFFFQKASIVLF